MTAAEITALLAGEPDDAARVTPLRTWIAPYAASKDIEVATALLALVRDRTQPPAVLGAAYVGLRHVAGDFVPDAEHAAAARAYFDERIDWEKLRELFAGTALVLPNVASSIVARSDARRLYFEVSDTLGRTSLTLNGETGTIEVQQRRGPSLRAWRGAMSADTWADALMKLERSDFPREPVAGVSQDSAVFGVLREDGYDDAVVRVDAAAYAELANHYRAITEHLDALQEVPTPVPGPALGLIAEFSRLLITRGESVYSGLIAIGKAPRYAEASIVAPFLDHPYGYLRGAAIRVLGFYWGKPEYRERAREMARHDPDIEARCNALAALGTFYRGTRDVDLLRELCAIVVDRAEPDSVRSHAWQTLLLTAGVPREEYVRATGSVKIERTLDWDLLRRAMSGTGVDVEAPRIAAHSACE